MSDSVKQLEEQLLALKKGLFLMSPRDRIRALSTHETEDLIIELQDVADAALKSLESVKN
jgi:ribosomal protein L29